MNLQAEENIGNERGELNRVFDAILLEYKSQKTLVKNLENFSKIMDELYGSTNAYTFSRGRRV